MRKLILIFTLIVIFIVTSLIVSKYRSYFSKQKIEDTSIYNFGNYLAASVAQKTGDYNSAIKNLETALLKDQDNTKIIKKLYGLYLYTGDYEKAIEQARRNIEINKLRNSDIKKISPIPYVLVAIDEFKNGDVKKVPELLEKLADPKIPDKTHVDGVILPLILAWSYAVNDDFQKSFKVIDGITADYMLSIFSYNRALINDLANNKPIKIDGFENATIREKALHFIAEIFFEIGQFSLQNTQLEEATIYVRIARFIEPQEYKYTKLLGIIFESQGKYEDAIKVYSEVTKENEGFQDSILAKAIALSRDKKNHDSLELLEQVSANKDLEFQAKFTAGSILLADENYEPAIEKFQEALKLISNPTKENWALYFNLGVAYDKASNWNEAEKYLVKSVELFPENPESLNYLAYSWLVRNKNIDQARKMLESAVIRSGGAAHILDSYGWALLKMNMFDQALPFLEQASISLPYNSVINDHLGDLYWKLGRKREAKFLWQRALENYNIDLSLETTEEQLKAKIENGF
jgi:tetratricopeptide (TPR) repeat protein